MLSFILLALGIFVVGTIFSIFVWFIVGAVAYIADEMDRPGYGLLLLLAFLSIVMAAGLTFGG